MESLENAAKKWSTDNKDSNGGGQLIPAHVDISDKDSIQKLYKEISSKEDQLHLLVNNVSYLKPCGALGSANLNLIGHSL